MSVSASSSGPGSNSLSLFDNGPFFEKVLAYGLAQGLISDQKLEAIHTDAPVGVDVERMRPDLDWRPIARRCLDVAEVEALLALPPAEAARAFVQAWCDLEAGIKARGVGLARASDGRSRAMEPRLRRWRLALPAGYAGAVALLDPG